MKKRLFAIMLALALVLAAVPALAEGEGEPDKTAEKVEKQEAEQGEATRNSTPIEQNEQQQSNEAQLKSQPVKAPASPVGTGDCSAGHDWSKKDGKCVKCGFECKHDWQKDENDIIQPTCTQSGTVRLNCKICGKATRQSNAKPLGHEYNDGVVTKNPTETETGIKTFTCKNCNATYTEVIPAKGAEGEGTHVHVWPTTPDTIVPATCSKKGEKIYKCTVSGCDHTKTEVIPIDPNAHNYSIKGEFKTPVTCLKDGLQILECEHCGDKTVATVKAPGSHAWGAPTWAWSNNCSVATATFNCTREGCNESQTIKATVTTSNEYGNCYVYTKYTAKVTGPDGKEYSDSKTANCRRPDWYYDDCYYRNTCGHWGCGDVCTRYSNCVPCRNYRTTFRVGGYNCLATPKTGDVSVIGMALISLAGAGAAIMGKNRK